MTLVEDGRSLDQGSSPEAVSTRGQTGASTVADGVETAWRFSPSRPAQFPGLHSMAVFLLRRPASNIAPGTFRGTCRRLLRRTVAARYRTGAATANVAADLGMRSGVDTNLCCPAALCVGDGGFGQTHLPGGPSSEGLFR